jgi:hypothetical protein
MDPGGGDFYALTDDQLKRLLAGELDPAQFLQAGGGEQPREHFGEAAALWYELSQVLQAESGCGAEQTTAIPAMAGFSWSQQVQATAGQLAKLADAQLRTRCEGALMEASADQVLAAVRALTAFYQRAAGNQDAVLFRVA